MTKEQVEIRRTILEDLALSMRVRGKDGTGMFSVKNKQIHIAKLAIPVEKYLKDYRYQSLIDIQADIVIGHTRWKTTGEINDEQAQPLEVETVIGVHNGTLKNWQKIYPDALFDSEAVMHLLYQNRLRDITGNHAIVWVDKNNLNRINFYVKGKTLSLCFVEELQTTFFCSLAYNLKAIIAYFFENRKIEKLYGSSYII